MIDFAQIETLVPLAQRGDQRAWSTIATELMPYVLKLANHYGEKFSDAEFDDLVQAGQLGLKAAIDSWRAGHGSSFSTWAWRHISGAIANEATRHRHPEDVELALDGVVDAPCDLIPDTAALPDEACIQGECLAQMQEAVAELASDVREELIVEERWLSHDPASLAALGGAFGLSGQRVGQIEARMLARVQAAMLDDEET